MSTVQELELKLYNQAAELKTAKAALAAAARHGSANDLAGAPRLPTAQANTRCYTASTAYCDGIGSELGWLQCCNISGVVVEEPHADDRSAGDASSWVAFDARGGIGGGGGSEAAPSSTSGFTATAFGAGTQNGGGASTDGFTPKEAAFGGAGPFGRAETGSR